MAFHAKGVRESDDEGCGRYTKMLREENVTGADAEFGNVAGISLRDE